MVTLPFRGESRPRAQPRGAVRLAGGGDVRAVSPAGDPGVNAPAAAFGAAGAQALGSAADNLSELGAVADKFRRADEATELGTKTAEAKRRLKELEFSLENDTDFKTVTERYQAGAEAIRQEMLQSIESDRVRGSFQNAFSNSSLISEFSVRSSARKRQVEFGQGQLTRNLDALSGLMADATSEPDREDIKRKAVLSLENARQTGLIGADKQATLELDFLAKAETVRARRDLQNNPAVFSGDILDPAKYPDLDESRRQVLSEQADRRVEALQREHIRLAEKAERDQDKAERQAQDDRAADLRVQAMNGTLREDSLVTALTNREIRTEQFDSTLSFLRRENAGTDDPQTVLDLQLGLQQGRYGATDVMARKESLTQETMEKMLTLSDQVSRRGGVLARDDVKREISRIDQVIGGVRGPLAVLDGAASERVSNAIREAQDRILSNENPREVADDVIERYRQQPVTLGSLGRPQHWQGSVTGDKKSLTARLADAQRRAIASAQAGTLTPGALRMELQRLEEFKSVIDAMPDKAK